MTFVRTILLMLVAREPFPKRSLPFLDSSDFEHAIRLAVSLGGDSDTLACITGGIAEVYYGMPEDIKQQVYNKLPNEFLKSGK